MVRCRQAFDAGLFAAKMMMHLFLSSFTEFTVLWLSREDEQGMLCRFLLSWKSVRQQLKVSYNEAEAVPENGEVLSRWGENMIFQGFLWLLIDSVLTRKLK